MAATTAQNTSSLTQKIIAQFGYTFVAGDTFCWSPASNSITYINQGTTADLWTLLHEIGHAELGHSCYELDMCLMDQEVAAWEHAQHELAPRFELLIDDDHIQEHLDTYRIWLHERSRCPQCSLNGFQTTQNTYSCSNCRCLWRVNDARGCALRRIRLQGQDRSS